MHMLICAIEILNIIIIITVANLPLVINSVDQPNIRFYSPPTQHHSIFRNYPILGEILNMHCCDKLSRFVKLVSDYSQI